MGAYFLESEWGGGAVTLGLKIFFKSRVTWCNSNVKKEIILKLLNPAEHNFCPFANLL